MRVREKTLTPRALLREIVTDVARERCLDPDVIMRPSHVRAIIGARTIIAKRLFARGQSERRIALMMRVSLQTVRNYLGPYTMPAHHKEEDVSP